MTSTDPKTQLIDNKSLLTQIRRLRSIETRVLVRFLHYLAEVERRKLPLELGFPSTWQYLTKRLGFAEHAARRRVIAARLLARFPIIEAYLLALRINLTTLCELRDVLGEATVVSVLDRASGLSMDDTRRLVATMRPGAIPPDVMPRSAPPAQVSLPKLGPGAEAPAPAPAAATGPHQALGSSQESPIAQAAGAAAPGAATQPTPIDRITPVSADMDLIQLSVPRAVIAKLEKAKGLLSHKLQGAPSWRLLEEVLDVAIVALERKKLGSATPRMPPTAIDGRRLNAALARAVWQRDGGACTFAGADGQICRSTTLVEFQHRIPGALGGESSLENVTLYCRPHNQLAAERDFGAGYVERRREQTRITRAVLSAVRNLGYSKSEAEHAVAQATAKSSSPPTFEAALRAALRCLTRPEHMAPEPRVGPAFPAPVQPETPA